MEFQGRVAAKGRTLAECLASAGDLDAAATDHVTIVQDGTEPGGVVGDLSELARFPGMRMLRIFGPVDVTSLASLEPVGDRLEYLHCVGPVRVGDLASLRGQRALRRLALEGLEGLTTLGGLERLASLDTLELSGADVACNDVGVVGALARLHAVELRGFHSVADLTALGACVEMEKFEIVDAPVLARLPSLARWPKLKTFHVSGATALEAVPDLGTAVKLKSLELRNCPHMRVSAGFDKLTKVANLAVTGSPGVVLPPLGSGFSLLRSVMFSSNHLPGVRDGAGTSTIDKVAVLGHEVVDHAALASLVFGARKTVVLNGLQQLPGGRPARAAASALVVEGPSVVSTEFLSAFVEATTVVLNGVKLDGDALLGVSRLPVLEFLTLERCSGVHDASALGSCVRLARVDVRDCPDLDYDTIVVPAGVKLAGDNKATARARALAHPA